MKTKQPTALREYQDSIKRAKMNRGAFAAEQQRRAEAYPGLVASLKELKDLMESGMLVNHPQCSQDRRNEHSEKYGRASELLRELGEG